MLSKQAYWIDGRCGVCTDDDTFYFVEQGQCVSEPAKNAFLDKHA